jgi:hypothetical protein
MGQLNNANKAQRALILELFKAGNASPSVLDRQAFEEYQTKVMQPIRDSIAAAADAGEKAI